MAGKKENIKALFSNTRSRVIIVFTAVLLFLAVIIGVIKLTSSMRSPDNAGASLGAGPVGIESVPGSLNPTAQYASLQQTQNVEQAEVAAKTGKSAIPTIIRTQAFGDGVESVGAQQGQGGVGFSTLAREDAGGPQQSLWLQSLKDANCSKASVDSVVSQGATLKDLRAVCSCLQLKDDGYQFKDLEPVCSCKDLKGAGYNARQMKDAGFTAERLRLCGFDACELRGAGFTAQQMKDGGFSDGELKGAGFSDDDIARASGLPDGITADDVRKAGCQADALSRLRAAGVTAGAIRRISGCSAAQLKAAGFTAQDLKNAGFSAADLLKAGYSPADLKNAGFSARDLLNAGLTPDQLAAAGFTPDEIKAAEEELPPGMTPSDVKAAGCNVEALKRERLAGVSAEAIRKDAGCSAQALKAAGFTPGDLANAGFTPAEINPAAPFVSDDAIKAAGCDPTKLRALFLQGVSAKRIHDLNGCSAQALKAAGYDAKALTNAGFTPQQLLAAGFTPAQINAVRDVSDAAIRAAGCDPQKLRALLLQGVTAKQIHDLNGCSADALKNAGFNAQDLANAGFTPEQLLAAGFTPQQLLAAGISPSDIEKAQGVDDATVRAAGCDPQKLHELFLQGVSAKRIHDLNGCNAQALKNAGYDAQNLANAGFTPSQLLAAGFTPQQLKDAGLNPSGVIATGRTADCSADSLRAAHAMGVSASTIKQTLGCSAQQLKDAGYTAAELKAAGFTAAELKGAGFSAADLKAAGFTAKELRAAGFTAQQLKDAGFTAQQLKDAGFSAADLKNAGFTAEQLKAAGYSAKDLKDAGFNAQQLRNAGYSNQDLADAGLLPSDSSLTGLQPLPAQSVPTSVISIPPIGGEVANNESAQAANTRQLQEILKRQQSQMADQRYQQKIQQRTTAMLSAATQALQDWKTIPSQVYVSGNEQKAAAGGKALLTGEETETSMISAESVSATTTKTSQAIIKAGDVIFAVLDTSVNSDEPGPILATVVSGKLNGAKLIGSFTLPSNADKMVISFNTMSVPGASKTTAINAYAIDPNTARTALSSRTNHHYLLRYGSLFAATFLEGFGNAFQSANTTVTIGGTGGVTDTTIQNGVGRSILENAVIGLATLGKSWGQVAQQQFSTPTTVDVFSGTGVGVLFTQDVASL
jgi:intracellular multiplication protein IcmE